MKNNEKMSNLVNQPTDTADAPAEDHGVEENDDVVKLMQAIPNDIFSPDKSKASRVRSSQQEEDPEEYLTAIRLPSEMERVDAEMKSLNLAVDRVSVEQDMK